MDTIQISTSLLDREDLDLYAKMCCIVLARAAQEEPTGSLSLEALARQMGCTVRTADKALTQLVQKGLLIQDISLDAPPKAPRVRRKDQESPSATFEAFDGGEKLSLKQQLEALREFIHEPATDGTLKIILNMAAGNVERIRRAYQVAAAAQISDTLEMLINLLQQAEAPDGAPEPSVTGLSEPEALEPETRQVLNQINQKRIAELYHKNRQKR